MKPKVSIVIPTWKRLDLLDETMWDIARQEYGNFEVIVVSDGQDKRLSKYLDMYKSSYRFETRHVQLGRNWSGLDPKSFGIAPLLVGYLMATGKYVMPWCDDERALTLDHIEMLVTCMETPIGLDYTNNTDGMWYPDFAYPRVHIWRHGNPNNHENTIIGTEPPVHGQITHYIFRPENFIKFGYPDWKSDPVDWSLIEKWLKNGAKGIMLPEITFEHRLDR